ncbi:MAG: hypothetical protein LBV08_11360, partial [Clostridiales bacterium]|nr:hypothetical protein [Clostridiales bacterium]
MDTAIMGAYETNLNELKSMVFDDISIIESENLASSVTYIKSLADRNRLKKVEIKLEGVEDMEAGPMEGIGKLYCNQVYVFAEGSYLDIIGYINDIQKNGDRYYLSGLDIR